MDTHFCIDALEEAIERHAAPNTFNTDQGSQFTSEEFTGMLKQHGSNQYGRQGTDGSITLLVERL